MKDFFLITTKNLEYMEPESVLTWKMQCTLLVVRKRMQTDNFILGVYDL